MDEDSLLKRKNKAQRDGNVQVLADVNKKLGDLFYDKKRYEDALEAYKGQLDACECLGDKLNSAIAHRMIGEVYGDIGKFKEAINHQSLYLEIAKELKDLIEEQRAFATLGRTYLLVADSLVKESEMDKKMEVLRDAKKAFSKSIRLCDKFENKIDVNELMMMRARLLLNLGLVLEQQKDTEQALNLIKQAASLCRKHNLHEDLHRTNIAFAGLNERLGNSELAIKNLDDAAKIDDVYLKADARLLKAELLLKLGEWMEAQKLLHNLYKSKRLLEPVKQQVTRLLRIAVVLCKNEDNLLTEDDLSAKEKLYEQMGDAATAVRSLDKAVEYYRNMLACAEETKSNQLGAALTSLAQTLRDAGQFQEAIPYARRELELCRDSKEACSSALYLAGLLVDANKPDRDIREMFDRALASARECSSIALERSVTKELVEYLGKLEDVDLQEIEGLNERLERLPCSESSEVESEEEEENTPDIGADICLDELSDVEGQVANSVPQPRNVSRSSGRRHRCVVKKNEKGESQLHVACIKGNIVQVEKLLEEQHPTSVRDHCGWTPLHEASNHGFVEVVRCLVRHGADVNDPGGSNCEGVTALHDAAANGHTAVVQLLLDSGADPGLLTRTGDSALDCLEQWRTRVGELTPRESKEYAHAKKRLEGAIGGMGSAGKRRKKKERREAEETEERRWNALVDDEEEARSERLKTVDTWAKAPKPERISAGEDYKRTIAAMQHPGRVANQASKQACLPRITAPLLDSEEMLFDDRDWLEDDLGPHRERPYFAANGGGNAEASVTTAKRKSKNDSDQEMEREVDKSMKRQRISMHTAERDSPRARSSSPLDEDSCASGASDALLDDFHADLASWPTTKRKKPRQTNLLRQGFTRSPLDSGSASASVSPEPVYAPAILRAEQERHSWDSGAVSETIDLAIHLDEEDFELKLHLRDLRKTMSDIEELIRHKFEAKTGCRPRMAFKTAEGVALAAEITLEEVPRDRSKLSLFGEITQNDLPPIVDRYKKVCETFGIDVTDCMLKSLRSCDNTSTYRLPPTSTNLSDTELEPLVRCLHYQRNLQSLNLSNATFYNSGVLLNHSISHLSSLCELHLQCCDIDSDCLAKIDRLPGEIRVLDLSYNPLGGKSQKKLHELLEPLKRLQSLCLRYCDLDDFKFALRSGTLVNLDVSWNPIGGGGAANLLQRQLLSLNLSNTQSLAYDRINVIDKIFYSNSMGFSLFTLESLELSTCQATDLDVETILSQTPNLTRLVLSNNINVTRTSLCAVLRRKPTMSHVDLSGCRLIDEPPDVDLRLATPQACTLLVHMKLDVIEPWEALWQGKGYSRKLPHLLVAFKPI